MTLPVQQNPPGLRPPSLENGGPKVSPSSRGDVTDKVTEGFRLFLTSKNYSSATVRNYISDIGSYFDFIQTLPNQNPLSSSDESESETSLKKGGLLSKSKVPFFKGKVVTPQVEPKGLKTNGFRVEILSLYLKTISSDPNYRRYLSSLSKFFQYTQDQGLVKTNPLKAALRDKKPGSDEILNDYQNFLTKKRFSSATIKNYLNDIRQFSEWTKSTPNQNPPAPTLVGTPSLEKGGLKTKKSLKQLMTSLFKGGRGPLGKVGLNES